MLRRSTILVVLVILLLLAPAASAQDGSRVLRFAYASEPGLLSPYFSILEIDTEISSIYLQPPWGMNSDTELIPILTEELPSLDNGGVVYDTDNETTTITFTLADWAVWSDGAPMVADDFVILYDIATDGVSGFLEQYMGAAEIRQGESEKEVVIFYDELLPDWYVAQYYPMPSHLLREPYEAALAEGSNFDSLDWLRNPTVSNAPFVFAEWDPGSTMRFVRNENYWKDVWADELVIGFYSDTNVIQQLIKSDEIDWTRDLDLISANEVAGDNPDLKITTYFEGSRRQLKFNTAGHPALADKDVRRAIIMGIDRSLIIEELFEGLNTIPLSLWDGTPWVNPDLDLIGYDPDGAVEMLREKGWYDDDGDGVVEAHGVEGVEDGTPLELIATGYSNWTIYEDVLLTIQQMLDEIGVEVNVTLIDVNLMHDTYTNDGAFATGAYDMYMQGWWHTTESMAPSNYWACEEIPSEENPGGQNGEFVCIPEMDELWQTVANSLDTDERLEAVYRVQEIMADENFVMFIQSNDEGMVMQAGMENVRRGKFGTPFYNVNEWQRTDS